jgi:hypothetical protein
MENYIIDQVEENKEEVLKEIDQEFEVADVILWKKE